SGSQPPRRNGAGEQDRRPRVPTPSPTRRGGARLFSPSPCRGGGWREGFSRGGHLLMRTIVHLTASAFYGGPQRQMLGLTRPLPEDHRTVFVTSPEKGQGQPFQDEIRRQGIEGIGLAADTPRFRRVIRELVSHLDGVGADILCCHGYKANLLGRPAA